MERLKEIEERLAAISTELEGPEADLNALEEEIRALKDERKAINEQIEKRAALLDEVEKTAKVVEVPETEERTKEMTDIEIRNTKEYIDAYAKYIRTEDASECRALLSDGAANGTVAIPAFVLDIVTERVDASKLLSRVRRVNFKGIGKVGFEISAPEAEWHAEGGEAIDEENLTLGIVTMTPAALKKWVSFSDELMDNSEAFLRYIYDEITRGIIKAAEKAIVDAIIAAPTTATATAPAVAEYENGGTAALDDFVQAIGKLKSTEDLAIIVSPADYANYRGLQLNASYGADPFDGRDVIISDYATVPIVGNLYGVTANFPTGENIQFKLDDRTLMKSDMVQLLGRLPAAIAVTSNLFFARIVEGE